MADRRHRRKDQTRRALLDAALALIAERGIYATRIEDVTERIDLGKGAFYNYFESKDALVAALAGEGVERLAGHFRAHSDANTGLAGLTRLHQQFFEDHPQYLLLLHQARGLLQLRPDTSSSLRDVFRDYLECLAAIFIPHRPGHPAADDCLAAAAVIAGALTGTTSFLAASGLSAAPDLSGVLVEAGLSAITAPRERAQA